MNSLVMGALVALTMVQQTDTVIPVNGATTLEVSVMAGSITVTGWDRNEIGIKAEHSTRTFVEIRRARGGERIMLDAESSRGPAGILDFTLQVPRSMALVLDAMNADIIVDGVNGSVDANVIQGEVTVSGAGAVKVNSATGTVLVDGAVGSVDAATAAGDIRLVNVAGDVQAESAGGDIVILNSTAASVDVGTVGGRIHYDGAFNREGTYFFGNHGGTITLVVPQGAAATFNLSSAFGTIVNSLQGSPDRLDKGERHKIELGGGGALVEAETFGGRISLVRKGAPGSEPPSVDVRHERDPR